MTALAALHQQLFARLRGDAQWGDRVYPESVPAGTARPYVWFSWAGGGEELEAAGYQHARLTVSVRCVAETMAEAHTGAATIETLLRSQGSQEGAGLVSAGGWTVTTITQERVVHLVEMWQGAANVYHAGHQYIFQMEAD